VVAWRGGEDRRAPGRRRREAATSFGIMEEEAHMGMSPMGEPMERGGRVTGERRDLGGGDGDVRVVKKPCTY
jgi:hypothetical protein